MLDRVSVTTAHCECGNYCMSWTWSTDISVGLFFPMAAWLVCMKLFSIDWQQGCSFTMFHLFFLPCANICKVYN